MTDRIAGAVRVSVLPTSGVDSPPVVVAPPAASAAAAGPDPILVDGEPVVAVLEPAGRDRATLRLGPGSAADRHRVLLSAAQVREEREVVIDGWRFVVRVESERRAALRERASRADATDGPSGPTVIRAIIPGRVVAVFVNDGDPVEAGGRLLVVEAMKMQNELRAPRDGTIGRVGVSAGETIEVGDLLVVLE